MEGRRTDDPVLLKFSSTRIAMLELLCKILPTIFITPAVLGHTNLLSRWPLFLYMDTGLQVTNILLAPLV